MQDFSLPHSPTIAGDLHSLLFALDASGIGLWELSVKTNTVIWDDRCKELFGLSRGGILPYAEALGYIHPDDVARVKSAVSMAISGANGGRYEARYRTIGADDGQLRWVLYKGQLYQDAAGQPDRLMGTAQDITAHIVANQEVAEQLSAHTPLFNADGEVYAIMDMAVAVTEQLTARKKLEESELFARTILENSPVAKIVFSGEDMLISMVNEKMLEMLGRDASIIGQPFMVAMPELLSTPLMDRLRHVLVTGETYYNAEERFEMMRYGQLYTGYYSYIYKALRNTAGEIYGIITTAAEVTAQVLARQKVEESEAKFRSLIQAAPVGIGLFIGRDLVIEGPNQAFIDIVGKGWDIVGQPLATAMPELDGQPFLQILDDVYTSGKIFQTFGTQVDIVQHGVMRHGYYDFSYTPLFDTQGKVYGILDIAVDVTEQVMARQRMEETEEALRGAIELAELGTWSIDLTTRLLTYSDRLNAWFGFTEKGPITIEQAYEPILARDRPLVKASITHAITPGTDGIYDVEYTIIDQQTGRERILHAQGKAVFDEQGVAHKINGTAQDVTEQRRIQLALEQQVQERTEELAASNEKLRTTNQELAVTNARLQHSNEELAQYAYVASHDLQEPLRKIRMFSGMLREQVHLSAENIQLVTKINQSSERMSMLIQDLLEFSRLLNSEALLKPVDLGEVCRMVIDDFELAITETGAVVQVGALPVIVAVGLQMNQLFYNLFSNALKFSRPSVSPVIAVEAQLISAEAARKYVYPPNPAPTYYYLTFTDNGIGFEEQYAEQIFEVFKRLHGRAAYPGSGIGLALCRRIVANQGGHLYATSVPGEGTTFHIILPDRMMK